MDNNKRFIKGDRVYLIGKTVTVATGLKEGSKGTIISAIENGYHVDTDKLNKYNHSGCNGIYIADHQLLSIPRDFRVGDRVELTKDRTLYDLVKGDTGTIMKLEDDKCHFINTDRPNRYNFKKHGGNGIWLHQCNLELINPMDRPPVEEAKEEVVAAVKPTIQRWSIEDIDYLHCYYMRKPVQDIADHLNRTYGATVAKAQIEGLKKCTRTRYSKSDISHLHHCYIESVSTETLSRELHRTNSGIYQKMAKLKKVENFPIIPAEVK